MAEWKFGYFRGEVQLLITGYNKERFLNIACTRGIRIHDITKHDHDGISCRMSVSDFKQLKPICKKTDVKIKIIDRYGLPFCIWKNKGRKLMITGILAFFLFLYTWSCYIWDISLEGNRKFTDETILDFMETISVQHGMRKTDISCERLEEEIRNHFPEIIWVSAEITGTRLLVSVRENDALLSAAETNEQPCNLVAAKDGVIVGNIIRNGISQVQAGDSVIKDQVLVEGLIPIYDDAENLVNLHEIRADAEIFAETTDRIRFQLPPTTYHKVRTGSERKGFFIEFMGEVLYLMRPGGRDMQWEYITDQKQFKLFRNFYLPVYFGSIHAYEVSVYERLWQLEEVQKVMDTYVTDYKENLAEKGIQILGSDGRIEQDESGWHYEGTLRLVENIAVEAAIPENQKENQTLNECN